MRFALSKCEECGLPLKFIQKPGKGGVLKYWPVNPDGTDHFDLCSAIKAKRVGYITAEGLPNMDRMNELHPPVFKRSRYTHGWCGPVPPWDESLGQFRDFSTEEKAQGVICRPFERHPAGPAGSRVPARGRTHTSGGERDERGRS